MKKLLSLLLLMLSYGASFAQLTLSSNVQHVSCFSGSNGTATVTATGGTPTYSYTWMPGNITYSVITGVPAGTYTVTVADAATNTASLIVTVTQPTQLTATASQTNILCAGNCTGKLSALTSGGTAPYYYVWSNGVAAQVTSNLCAGIYTYTITDSKGCNKMQSTSISQPSPISIAVTQTPTTCGNCSGALNMLVTGGNPAYMFNIVPGNITTTQATNLCSGNYTLQVTDVNNCTQITTVTIGSSGGSIPNATVSSVVYSETCYLTGDGAIDLTITGTNPGPFIYQWSNGATTQDINNVVSNAYSVNITDASSHCMVITNTVNATGTNCGTISGNVYVDNNSDCIKNSGDNNVQNAMVTINPGNRLGYTDPLGNYTINSLPYGTYSVSLNVTNTGLIPSCTATLTPTVNAGNANSTNNLLSVAFNSGIQPDIYGWANSTAVVPGFVSRANYYLRNYNNASAFGVFKAVIPTAFVPTITSAFPPGYTQSGDTVIWNFSNVGYNSFLNFYIDFVPPVGTVLGSTFTTCATAQTTATDLNPANNSFCYSRLITGSFDPNDKAVSPVGTGTTGYITVNDAELNYLIRFQNTGNGPAVNIVVKDTISAALDISSFEMLSSSHMYKIDIMPGNILRWKFDNIQLPDSGSNQAGSHGYIQYRIKQKANNPLGTKIKNTAYIYFDFNSPVITNTALNTIAAPVSVGLMPLNYNDATWIVYPNPSTGIVYAANSSSAAEAKTDIHISNAIGQTVYEETFNGNTKLIDLSKLTNGIYFIKIISDKETTIKRIVLNK